MAINSSYLVSVIVTTYNRPYFLKQTLDSIANQTYDQLEIIVVDDGSTTEHAETNKILSESIEQSLYFFKKNTGQPDSRNFGIQKAKGAFIAFCDDDDLWVPEKLQKQMDVFRKLPEIGLVSGCIRLIDHLNNFVHEMECPKILNGQNNFGELLLKNKIKSPTPILKREVFDQVGYFNTNFTIAEDWEFWRRVSYYYPIYSIKEVLAYVRIHKENMTKMRENNPLNTFKLYRKLTRSLLDWGKTRFDAKDYQLINNMEWLVYRKLLINHVPGFFNRLTFFFKILTADIRSAVHVLTLFIKYEYFNGVKK